MHRMTAGDIEIAMVVSVFWYKLVDIIPLLILIIERAMCSPEK